MLTGWKTYLAAAAMVAGGIAVMFNGQKDLALQLFAGALAAVGLGHKADRVLKALETKDE